jgi:hypothetical protein
MAALVWIAADLGAILALHVSLQLMDRRRLRSPHDVEGNGLVCVAAKAFHFEVAVPGVERVAQRGRWMRRTLEAEHALVPFAELIRQADAASERALKAALSVAKPDTR